MKVEITVYDPVADDEFEAIVNITSFGSPPHMGSLTYAGDPGDPPEWEEEKICDPEGHEVPFRLRPTLRQRFEAWFNAKPLLGSINPEYMRLSELVTKYMEEDFDWPGYQDDFGYDDYYD